jgi:hypothetical protein
MKIIFLTLFFYSEFPKVISKNSFNRFKRKFVNTFTGPPAPPEYDPGASEGKEGWVGSRDVAFHVSRILSSFRA